MFQVTEKIKATRLALLSWQRRTFKARQAEIDVVRDQITSIDAHPYSETSVSERYRLMEKLDSLLMDEETYWRRQ